MKPEELIIEAGELLFGDQWPGPLGNAINVNPRTLRAIKEGRFDLPKDHPMIRETLALLVERQRDINAFLKVVPRAGSSSRPEKLTVRA